MPFTVFAQSSIDTGLDFGLFVGGSYYVGDLNPNGHFNKFTRPAGGIVFRYNMNSRTAFRANLIAGSVAADDAYSNSQWQLQRDLNFNSHIYELSALFEFNFFNYTTGAPQWPNMSPYIFFGLAGFNFEPERGSVELQPLGTEGQGLPGGASKKKYKLTQLSLPFGVGLKTDFSRGISIGFEWGMRKTFTDYIDDVSTKYYDFSVVLDDEGKDSNEGIRNLSGTGTNTENAGKQRGNSLNKDWYSFFGVVLTMRITTKPFCVGSFE